MYCKGNKMGYDINSESESVLSESSDSVKDFDVAAKTKKDKKPHKCTFDGCNLSFCRPSRLKRHMKFHTGERDYKCTYPECDKAYTNNCHLKRHMESHKVIKKLYKCPECSLHISNQHNLKRHYNTMHINRDKITCKECNETFAKKYQLKIHMTKHKSVLRKYKERKCKERKCKERKCKERKCKERKYKERKSKERKSFTNTTNFKKRKTYHDRGGKQYPCSMPGCNEVFKKWLLLCAHKKTQHVNDYKCINCGKIFLSKQVLRMHSQVHKENRSVIPCPFEKCPRVYYFKSNLNHHVRTYHLGKKYECDICKRKIATKQRLAAHIQKLHMSEKRIKKIKKGLERKRRKDAGVVKKSTLSKLVGINLPITVEKMVLRGEKTIPYLDQLETESNCNADYN